MDVNMGVRRNQVGVVKPAGAGLAAGIIMALVAMMATAAMGKGLFAAPAMIAGIILGPDAMMTPTMPVILTGLALHMVLSMMFGAVFGFIVPLLRVPTILLGAAFGLILWIMNFYVLSFVSSGARAMAANEPVALAVGTHLVFGLVLGAIVVRIGSHAKSAT